MIQDTSTFPCHSNRFNERIDMRWRHPAVRQYPPSTSICLQSASQFTIQLLVSGIGPQRPSRSTSRACFHSRRQAPSFRIRDRDQPVGSHRAGRPADRRRLHLPVDLPGQDVRPRILHPSSDGLDQRRSARPGLHQGRSGPQPLRECLRAAGQPGERLAVHGRDARSRRRPDSGHRTQGERLRGLSTHGAVVSGPVAHRNRRYRERGDQPPGRSPLGSDPVRHSLRPDSGRRHPGAGHLVVSPGRRLLAALLSPTLS